MSISRTHMEYWKTKMSEIEQNLEVQEGFQGVSQLSDISSEHFRQKIDEMISETKNKSQSSRLFVELLPHLIELLWQEFAQLKHHFGAEESYQTQWSFFLKGLELGKYPEETRSFFNENIGFPSWANIWCAEILDLDDLDAIWGDDWLHNKPEVWRLWWALRESQNEDDLNCSSEQRYFLEEKLTVDHEEWYLDRDLVGLFDYGVTPNLSLIESLQKERGFTYSSMSDDRKKALVEIASKNIKDEEQQESKAAHYLLSLLLNHPETPVESKAQIALLGDKHIIKLED